MGIEVASDHDAVHRIAIHNKCRTRGDRHLQFVVRHAAFDTPLGFERSRMYRSADQGLELTSRNGVVLHFVFEREHCAPTVSGRSFNPSIVISLIESRVREELRERSEVCLRALDQVFLRSCLLLDSIEASLSFLDQASTDSIRIALELVLEFSNRGTQFGLFVLFSKESLTNEAGEHLSAELGVLFVVQVLVLVLILHDHLHARIKVRVRNLGVVDNADRIATSLIRNTVHGEKTDGDTGGKDHNYPLGFFINPR